MGKDGILLVTENTSLKIAGAVLANVIARWTENGELHTIAGSSTADPATWTVIKRRSCAWQENWRQLLKPLQCLKIGRWLIKFTFLGGSSRCSPGNSGADIVASFIKPAYTEVGADKSTGITGSSETRS